MHDRGEVRGMSIEDPKGQLCPYEECAWFLELHRDGWYFCGHCNKLLYARSVGSDYEDYHTIRAEEVPNTVFLNDIKDITTAPSLWASWATPERGIR